MKKDKFKPYIRLANGKEKSSSFRCAVRLAFYQGLGKTFYVLVQKGFKNLVLEVGPNKSAIKQSIVPVMAKWKTYKQWASDTKKYAKGKAA